MQTERYNPREDVKGQLFLDFESEKARIIEENGLLCPEKLTCENGVWSYSGIKLEDYLKLDQEPKNDVGVMYRGK